MILLVQLLRREPGLQRACQPRIGTLGAVAPSWHLRLLLCVLLLAPTAGLLSGGALEPAPTSGAQVRDLYLPLLLTNAIFAAYVSRIGLGQNKLRDLFGRLSTLDVPLGLALAAAVLGLDRALQLLTSAPESLSSHALLPRTTSAALCWLVIALSTAFAEELVYRGYLLQQFAAQSGKAAFGIALQAMLFGIAHGPQGPATVVRFGLYGLLLGAVAAQRRGLLAVVVCHSALDLYAGLLG